MGCTSGLSGWRKGHERSFAIDHERRHRSESDGFLQSVNFRHAPSRYSLADAPSRTLWRACEFFFFFELIVPHPFLRRCSTCGYGRTELSHAHTREHRALIFSISCHQVFHICRHVRVYVYIDMGHCMRYSQLMRAQSFSLLFVPFPDLGPLLSTLFPDRANSSPPHPG